MAPPGIMSLDEHLGNIGMPFTGNFSTADWKKISSSSPLLLSPLNFTTSPIITESKESRSKSPKSTIPSVFHDHDYFAAKSAKSDKQLFFDSQIDQREVDEQQKEEEEEDEVEEEIDIDCDIDFEDVLVCEESGPIRTGVCDDETPTSADMWCRPNVGLATSGGTELGYANNTSSSSNNNNNNSNNNNIKCFSSCDETHNVSAGATGGWSPVVVDGDVSDEKGVDDGDIFDGIDGLDFDFDEFDPFTDMSTDDSFQNFIDETLNDSLSHMAEEDAEASGDHAGEDVHRKEFFLKLLGLQAATMANVSEQTKTTFSSSSSSHSYDFPTPIQNHHVLNNSSPMCYSATGGSLSSLDCPNSSPTSLSSSSNCPSSCLTSVPAKVCSRCASDAWKNSALYSTAPGRASGRMQTCLATVTQNSYRDTASIGQGRSVFNDDVTTALYSGPLTASSQNDRIVDNSVTHSSSHSNDFPATKCVPQIDDEQDTGNEDELLKWLEDSESSPPSVHNNISVTNSEGNYGSSHIDLSAAPSTADHQRAAHATALLSPSTVHSLSDLDSFIDLEEYAGAVTSPVSPPVVADRVDWQLDHDNGLHRSHTGKPNNGEFTQTLTPTGIQLKCLRNSELRFRLSLLDDLSKGFMDDRGLEKRDFSGHSFFPGMGLEHCNADDVMESADSAVRGVGGGYAGELVSEAGNYPLSPFSASSRSEDDNLNLLGLFSDENSSMLIG